MLQTDLPARYKDGRRTLFVPFQPAEGSAESRDGATRRNNDAAADPWDGRIPREAHLRVLLTTRASSYVVRNLSPILDEMRAIKSAAEIAVIDRATRIGGEALMEAMRSTAPGVAEQELDAVARFIFVRHGAQGEAYRAIVASGPNAFFAHHRASEKVMEDGELVLMDYCPDLHYYRCDVTRQWPVNGKFSPVQRELYTFYLGLYEAILYSIKPHVTAQSILQEAVKKMDAMMATMKFSKPLYENAAKQFVEGYRRRAQGTTGGNLGHAVGMSTHDMGGGSGMMRPGLVFTIEPQFRIPEERIFIRLEDMIVITDKEARITSDFVPRSIDAVRSSSPSRDFSSSTGRSGRFTGRSISRLTLSLLQFSIDRPGNQRHAHVEHGSIDPGHCPPLSPANDIHDERRPQQDGEQSHGARDESRPVGRRRDDGGRDDGRTGRQTESEPAARPANGLFEMIQTSELHLQPAAGHRAAPAIRPIPGSD